jgi:Protein of unknown function (FYDLN_acid)
MPHLALDTGKRNPLACFDVQTTSCMFLYVPLRRLGTGKRGRESGAGILAMPEIKLGTKFGCFSCGTKFYDLGKREAICPKCCANQKDSVRAEAPAQGRPRPPVGRPRHRRRPLHGQPHPALR